MKCMDKVRVKNRVKNSATRKLLRQLIRCPFCHSEHLDVEEDRREMFIYCNSCGSRGPEAYSIDRCAELWNRREDTEEIIPEYTDKTWDGNYQYQGGI